MDMNDATLWWIVTGVAVAVELATGTFYLLMLAIGLAAAAVAAHLGTDFATQLVAAALIGGGAVTVLHLRRAKQPASAPASANRDVNIDIGERVTVAQWNADGTTRVHYRGASWAARYAGTDAPAPGEHVIRAVDGNQLLLGR